MRLSREHRVTSAARSRVTSQRSARVAPRPPSERPVSASVTATTMGTTRTIGTPAPAYAGGQVAQGGTLGLLGSTGVMNVPFSTTNYTSQLIENQQARTAADTLINNASVRATTGAVTASTTTLQIRGFPVPASDVGLNGHLRAGFASRVPAYFIERIELLLGPGALINGMAPRRQRRRRHQHRHQARRRDALHAPDAVLHEHRQLRPASGEQRPRYGANKEWGVRFNGVGRNGEASIDDGNWRTGLGALGLDYRGERFRWTLDAISQNEDTKNFRPQIGIQTTVPFIPAVPGRARQLVPGNDC